MPTTRDRTIADDFVRHLRRLNLALVLTSVALVVTSSLAPAPILTKAYNQIRDIASASENLTLEWVRSQYTVRRHRSDFRETLLFSDINRTLYEAEMTSNLLSKELEFYFYSYDDFESGHVVAAHPEFAKTITSLPLPPRRFRDFVEGWDLLLVGGETVSLESWQKALGAQAFFFDQSLGNAMPDEKTIYLNHEGRVPAEPRSLTSTGKLRPFTAFLSLDRPRVDADPRSDRSGWRLILQDYTLNSSRGAQARKFRIEIRLRALQKRLPLQARFAEEYGISDWRPGGFTESFPEAWEIAKHLDSVDMGQLEEYVRSRLSEARADIELLSMKFPYEGVRIWGILILLTLQYLFVLHLRQFRKWQGDGALTRPYPWVGLYSDRMSQGVFLFSSTALPTGSAISLAADKGYWHFPVSIVWFGVAMSVATAV